jgi:peptidoglycan/LPS O-acetylase OafA/YrhL
MNYRADIDGLRSLAVLPVLFFHAGFNLFSGGFVGVDIFFVISGYLITMILMKDIANGKYSLAGFYERRARRILPAYITMLVVVSAVAYLLFLPSEFQSLSESMFSSLAFFSNVYFWNNSGYFSIQAEYSPLLHTWSLSVEEQFYIFFPILLAFLYKIYNGKYLVKFVVFAFFTSLLLSILLMSYSKSGVFYLLPTRAWELLAGSLLALGVIPKIKNKVSAEIISMLGFTLIIYSVFTYTKQISFPGANALIPVLGAVMIIAAGNNSHDTNIKKLLSSKIFVYVGLISYPLYLWHWPIFTFIKNIYGHSPTLLIIWCGISLSFVLSWISYTFIEKPFRDKKILAKQKPILITSGVTIVTAMICSLVVIQQNGFPQRFANEVLIAEQSVNDSSTERSKCHIPKRNTISYQDKCVFGDVSVEPSYAFWGDSHSVELSDVLGKELADKKVSGIHISYSSCPPSQGFSWVSRPLCSVHNKEVLHGLKSDKNIKTVFLIARYNSYIKDIDMTDLMLTGFYETIDKLQDSGKEVIVIYPIPRSTGVTPLDIARNIDRNISNDNYFLSLSEYYKQNQKIQKQLDEIVTATNASVIKPEEVLCSDNKKCKFYINGTITHFDDDHLSLEGAKLFLPKLLEFITVPNYGKA